MEVSGDPEIVGDVGNQFSLVFVIISEGSCHEIHGMRQIAELILAIQADRFFKIPDGIISGCPAQFSERPVYDQPVGDDKQKRQHHMARNVR